MISTNLLDATARMQAELNKLPHIQIKPTHQHDTTDYAFMGVSIMLSATALLLSLSLFRVLS